MHIAYIPKSFLLNIPMKYGSQKIGMVSLHKYIVKFLSCSFLCFRFTLRLHNLQSLSTSVSGKGGILLAQPKLTEKGGGRERAEEEMPSVCVQTTGQPLRLPPGCGGRQTTTRPACDDRHSLSFPLLLAARRESARPPPFSPFFHSPYLHRPVLEVQSPYRSTKGGAP